MDHLDTGVSARKQILCRVFPAVYGLSAVSSPLHACSQTERGYLGMTAEPYNLGVFHRGRCLCFDQALQKLDLNLPSLFRNTFQPNYMSR